MAQQPRARTLREEGDPDHRVGVEHDRPTLLVQLGDEDGHGRTVLPVDRETRRWAVAQPPRRRDAAEDAHRRLYAVD